VVLLEEETRGMAVVWWSYEINGGERADVFFVRLEGRGENWGAFTV